jgi:hypothetical protein
MVDSYGGDRPGEKHAESPDRKAGSQNSEAGFLLPGWAWSAVSRLDGLGHETPNLVERPGPSSTTAAIGCRLFFPKDCSEDRVHYLATQFSSDRIFAHADYFAVLNLPQHLTKDPA